MDERRRGEPFAELLGGLADRFRGDGWLPAADVFETEKAVVVRLEVAGVRTEDLKVTVDGELLRVSGVRRPPVDADVQRIHQMEIAFGPFERSLRVSIPFERDAVSARIEEGFLTITLPRRGAERRRIEIER